MERKLSEDLERWGSGKHRICMTVSGCARVGKTSLIADYARGRYGRFIRLDLSDPSARALFASDNGADSLVPRILEMFPGPDADRTLLFLDGTHLCPDAWSAIKPLVRGCGMGVVSARSAHPDIPLRDGIPKRVSPMGHEIVRQLRPLDFEEFLLARGIGRDLVGYVRQCVHDRVPLGGTAVGVLDAAMREHIGTGGMPEMVLSGGSPAVAAGIRARFLEDAGTAPELIRRRVVELVSEALASGGPAVCGEDDTAALGWISEAGLGIVCRGISRWDPPLMPGSDGGWRLYAPDTGLIPGQTDDHLLRETATAAMIWKCGLPLYDCAAGDGRCFLTMLGGETVAIDASRNGPDIRALRRIADRVIRLDGTDIRVDADGTEHYPLFAAAFMDSMADERKLPESLDPLPLSLRSRSEGTRAMDTMELMRHRHSIRQGRPRNRQMSLREGLRREDIVTRLGPGARSRTAPPLRRSP